MYKWHIMGTLVRNNSFWFRGIIHLQNNLFVMHIQVSLSSTLVSDINNQYKRHVIFFLNAQSAHNKTLVNIKGLIRGDSKNLRVKKEMLIKNLRLFFLMTLITIF